MKIRTRLIIFILAVAGIILGISIFSFFEVNKFNQSVSQDLPNAINQIKDTSYLDSLAQFIRYYDEVLTQSARNYAFTGDTKWKDRYNQVAPDLDTKIKDALSKGDEQDKKFFADIDASNLALVEMEQNSMNLVDAGKKQEAVTILESQKYWDLKAVYKAGLEGYIAKRGANYNDALTTSTQTLNKFISDYQKQSRIIEYAAIGFIVIGVILMLLFLQLIYKSILSPLTKLGNAAIEVAGGNLEQKIEVGANDEIGEVARSFNVMTSRLKKSREDIEGKVKERTKDLEQLNKSMVGRELKMMELKKRIKELEGEKK